MNMWTQVYTTERVQPVELLKTGFFMSVRAKFKVQSVTHHENGQTVKLSPVIGDSEENKEFYSYTPAGEITLTTVKDIVADNFAVGDEFFVDFTLA